MQRSGKAGFGALLATVAIFTVLSAISVFTGTFVLVEVALFFGFFCAFHWLTWGRFFPSERPRSE